MVSRLYLAIGLLVCALLAGRAAAAEYKLNNGETVVGEALTASGNDQGVQIKTGEGQYQRVPWASFSQEDLKAFAKNEKLLPWVEPFIEVTRQEKMKKTEVSIKAPPRPVPPPRQSLFGAMFSSGLGLFVLVLVYGGGIYAGYEVSIFRAQSPWLVSGLSAVPVLGFCVPIVFLCLPTRLKPGEAAEEVPGEAAAQPAAAAAAGPGAAAAEDTVNPMQAAGVEHPTGLKLAHADTDHFKAEIPKTVTYQRGQFTFNRRFIETKFAGFFSVVRRDADRDMVLTIKSARGEYIAQRISRIAANDMHITVQRGPASEEVMIPFQDIQQIELKHRDA